MTRLVHLAIALVCLAAAPAAVASIALGEAELERVRSGFDESASYGDEAFGILLQGTRGWGRKPAVWAAVGEGPLRTPSSEADIAELTAAWPASAGAPVELVGKFVEREPLPRTHGMERWLLAPIDLKTDEMTGGPAMIVYVPTAEAATRFDPNEGWYVQVAGYFYRPAEVESRTTGQREVYPSFVGVVFASEPRRGTSFSAVFGWIGLAVAVMFSLVVLLVVIVARARSRSPRLVAARAAPAAEEGRPSDPADAMREMDTGEERSA